MATTKQERMQAKAVKNAAKTVEQRHAEQAQTQAVAKAMPKLPALPKVKKTKVGKPCGCGCGNVTKGGRFVPGHDARLHGWVIRVERNVCNLKLVRDTDGKGVALAVWRALQSRAVARAVDTADAAQTA